MRIVLFLLVVLSFYPSAAQDFREKIYHSYITGNMDSWETQLKSGNWRVLNRADQYEFAMAHYGFIGYCLGRDQKSRARPYLDNVELIADELIAKYPDDPCYLALRGALYGFRINYQPQKAMFLGPKALKKVSLALSKDPGCPQAWIESGNKDWFMPTIFGGSKTLAITEYEKAINIFAKDPSFTSGNWYYLNIQMILASWYLERGRTFAAHEIYRNLIKQEPRFTWAQEKLSE
jgi:tetratricopeptide (TPR) repeat protein